MLRAIQRHRELFHDNARELKRTKVRQAFKFCLEEPLKFMDSQTSVQNALDQANLLSGVRNDIEYVEMTIRLVSCSKDN